VHIEAFDLPKVLQNFFKKVINNQSKIDPKKLQNAMRIELGEFTDKLWPTVRKIFNNFRHPIKFEDYCRIVQNFISDNAGMSS
jgi:5-methylthioribose kinase